MEAASIVTNLGNYETVLALAVLAAVALAVGGRWRRAPVIVGIVAGGIWIVSMLKAGLALPRPPMTEIGGYGFPSGHAFMATVTYGLVAREVTIGPRHVRFVLAADVILAVSASRVLIGVHYPIDVIVGMLAGGLYLLAATRLIDFPPLGFGPVIGDLRVSVCGFGVAFTIFVRSLALR